MDAKNLADLYELPLLDWARIEAGLEEGLMQAPDTGGPNRHTCWLATINRDGSPHVTGVGGLWVEGSFWIATGERTRKGQNLAHDPRQRCHSGRGQAAGFQKCPDALRTTGPQIPAIPGFSVVSGKHRDLRNVAEFDTAQSWSDELFADVVAGVRTIDRTGVPVWS